MRNDIVEIQISEIRGSYWLILRRNGRVVASGQYDTNDHAHEAAHRLYGAIIELELRLVEGDKK